VVQTINHMAQNYTYDSLNRVTGVSASASTLGAAWGTTYPYESFGNLTDKTPTQGVAPAFHVAVTAATNRLVGYTGFEVSVPGCRGDPHRFQSRVTSLIAKKNAAASSRKERRPR